MTYHRPTHLGDALTLAASGARLLAGGTDILPAQTGRDLTGEVLDLTAVAALRGISETADGWRIGATTRWRDVMRADLPRAFDALKQAAAEVGSVQIQNAGTVAGNLVNASPAADGVPALLVLDAQVEVQKSDALRTLPLAEFITGPRRTALQHGEIVSAVLVPRAAGLGRSAFCKLGARKYLVISIAMVAARLTLSGGVITQAAIAVGACSAVAQRLPGLEAALIGQSADRPDRWQQALESDIAAHLTPIDDIRADSRYRSHSVAELVSRAILSAGAA